MVSIDIIESSNDRIRSTFKAGLVAVFVGETTVKQFAKYAAKPRVCIIRRSREAGDRLTAECGELNPEGTSVFLKHETSLMRNVDEMCHEIASKEEFINLLFLTVDTLEWHKKVKHRRLASGRHCFGASFEGHVTMTDFQGWKLGRMALMGHEASITTLALEVHHKMAPEVSFVQFVHKFPGAVEPGIACGSIGGLMRVLKTIWAILGPLVHIPLVEAGNHHLFFCTSARFSAGTQDTTAGVPLVEGLALARGTDGQVGSGVYSINENGKSASPKVEKLLAQFRS